ncbi:MAG: HAMP domain-containing histidine kinase [Euryarchaeota archaeon]|nr:HAMP domain-containing histidine kinase [Euryarchaeota archaeon]
MSGPTAIALPEPRLAIINAYTGIALAYCAGFGVLFATVADHAFLAVVHFVAFTVVLGNYLAFLRWRRDTPATHIILSQGTLVVTSLFATGGWEGTGFLWPFAYLPYAFFLARPRVAQAWVGILFAACLGVTALVAAGLIPAAYSPIATANYYAALVIFAGCMFLLQAAVVKYARLAKANARTAAEHKAHDAEKQREVDRLNELNEFKSTFLNMAAHELGTPLTPLKLQVHLLKSDTERMTPEQRQGIQILDRNINRLHQLVKDMMDSARLQASRLGLKPQDVDLSAIVVESVEPFRHAAAQANVAIDVGTLPPIPMRIDPDRMTQVVVNLVSNALKFTPAGGRVVVQTRTADGTAYIEVADTGAGMTEAQMERLFTPFTQVHDVRGRSGTGLGLYISRGIVELHGGRISVASRGKGLGSTFTVHLPLQRAPAQPTASPADAHPTNPSIVTH